MSLRSRVLKLTFQWSDRNSMDKIVHLSFFSKKNYWKRAWKLFSYLWLWSLTRRNVANFKKKNSDCLMENNLRKPKYFLYQLKQFPLEQSVLWLRPLNLDKTVLSK